MFNVFVSFIIDGLTNENLKASMGEKNDELQSFYALLAEVRRASIRECSVAFP